MKSHMILELSRYLEQIGIKSIKKAFKRDSSDIFILKTWNYTGKFPFLLESKPLVQMDSHD